MAKDGERIAIYIDGPNFYWTMKELGKRLDFREFLMLLGRVNIEKLTLKFFYDTNAYGEIETNPFLNYLKEMGVEIINVLRKSYDKNFTQKNPKSRTDQMLTVHLMNDLFADNFDTLILFTGDSDFEFVVHECVKKGKHVVIMSTQNNLSRQLKDCANEIIYIEKIKAGSKLFYNGVKI